MEHMNLSDRQKSFLGLPEGNKLSAASKRALAWPERPNEWFGEFEVFDLKGDLAYEDGVVRRDPSAIINIQGKYFVWYTRSTGPTDGFATDVSKTKVFPWDRADIWYATSEDGWTWKEEGLAIGRGDDGSYDYRSVFTPDVLVHEGRYYLSYQVLGEDYTVRCKEHIAMASADSPHGPWIKTSGPVLSPSPDGAWKGEEDNRFMVEAKGSFDSHKVHDPCILHYNGKFHLYYKGEQMGEEITWGGRQIRHGVAIADHPLGPYKKSEFNPISNSGHEICVWPYKGGIASLITTDGPEKNTVQVSSDGINFEIVASIPTAPHAIGINRTLDSEKPFGVFEWGLTHQYVNYDYQHIRRFEGRQKTKHVGRGEDGAEKSSDE